MSALLVSQKNDILKWIKESNLDPFNFEWKSVKKNKGNGRFEFIPALSYKDSPFYFEFNDFGGEHYAVYCPGGSKYVERQDYQSTTGWLPLVGHFKKWLAFLSRELSQTDQWEELSKYKSEVSLDFGQPSGNQPFTYADVSQIVEGISRIKEHIGKSFTLNAEQLIFINGKLDYLEEAAKRQGRSDWLHTSIGVMFTIILSLQASQEQANHLWKLLKEAIVGVVKLISQ